MKVLILAGGLGSRLTEETTLKPKPMVEIGGKPILWHIMKIYSFYGFNDFIILCGYKGNMIKSYFSNYYQNMSDLTVDLNLNSIKYHRNNAEPWKVTLVDTGLNSMTGSRIKKVKKYLDNEPFMLTYGDGVGNVNLKQLLKFHKKHGKTVTLTSCKPDGRYGSLELDDNNNVLSFQEKVKGDGSWVNAGFFVCEKEIFDYIPDGDDIIFEREPLEGLASSGNLFTYKHRDFWKPMDNMRDKIELENLISKNKAPWIKW
tara:strand:+ start:74 stop:847 length:774 start_codon:yes stop_codon:yes gene_type:complete